MKRIALSDGTWFDAETAVEFPEATWHDGRNLVSSATDDQFEHEKLYFTKNGTWILNHWSQWQGRPETYERVRERDAVAWIIRQGHVDGVLLVSLPDAVQKSILRGVQGAEV